MTGLLSIVRRELAVGARQTSTHRIRLMAGGAVVGLFTLFLLINNLPPNYVGGTLFGLSSFLLFVQALLSGLRYTADALSEEKREGTLGLLFLTELRSGEVVLGKMIVRSLRGFYALIATLPIFTLCLLFGGVTGLNAFYMALLLLTTMIFSLSACIFISSRVIEDKSAFIGSLGILAAFAFIPLILWKICFTVAPFFVLWDFLLYPSPIYAFAALPASAAHVWDFLRPIASLYLLSIAFLFFTARNLTRSFNEESVMAKSGRKHDVNANDEKNSDPRPSRTAREGPLFHQNTFFWLLARDRFYPKLMRRFAFCIWIALIFAVPFLSGRTFGQWQGVLLYGLAALHWVWKLLVASHALRRLHDDHRSGALEILLVTPLPIGQILSAQLRHTFRVCSGAALALCLGNLAVFALWQTFSDLPMAPIGGAIFLFIDARAITWQAMLQALRPARFPAAVLRVTGVTLLPPLLILMLITYSGRGFSSIDGNALFFFWFVACGIYDLVLIRRAKNTLNANFRLLAAETAKANPAQSTLPKALQWLLLRESAIASS